MDPRGERDRVEVDALITDRYLESLLARHAGGADLYAPDVSGEAPPADIARAADRLSRDLLRLHPSFRFEEALAVLEHRLSRSRLLDHFDDRSVQRVDDGGGRCRGREQAVP